MLSVAFFLGHPVQGVQGTFILDTSSSKRTVFNSVAGGGAGQGGGGNYPHNAFLFVLSVHVMALSHLDDLASVCRRMNNLANTLAYVE